MKHFKTLRAVILAALTATALVTMLVACTTSAPTIPTATPVAPSTAVAKATKAATTATSAEVTPTTAADPVAAAQKALTWLRSQQSITDSSYANSAGASVESLLAVVAGHEDANNW